ncbi:sialic acid-binding Ig-like lectin 5 isoform X2 [Heptranchias perlo]|uniref:sialic acid-binding Ig-like lectin 5 isoform X2 n=1 Tax=Heptranchias perlo TaxID=212740 RepID=UPI003559E461
MRTSHCTLALIAVCLIKDRPTKPTLSFSTGLVEGVRTSLMCSSSNVDPRVKASLNWYGIADLAAQQPKADGSTATLNSNFEFIPSYQDHNKIVKCSVNYSSYSYSDEANITLQVKYAPKNITVQVDDGSQLEIKEGDKVSLMCASNSHPEATYTWYKRKGNTSQTKSINTMRGTLLFQNISRRDSGFYNCTATNYLGSETSEALEIRVQYKPVEVNISQAGMSFTCIAEASPLAQITWNYTGNVKTVINGIWTISTLTLQTTSSVCVSCQAQNEHGSIRSVKQCFRTTQISASVLLQAITGSIVGAVLLIAIVLWMRRKHLFRGKNSESDSQPVFHNEVQDPQEDNRTSTSIADNTYDNVCMHMSPGEKLDAPRKDSEGAIVYASIQFDNKPKDLKPARYNSEQTIYNNTQGNQATTLTDSAEYENLEKYKNISKEAGPTKKDSEETILYANTKFTDNQKDPKPAKHKAQQTVYGVIRGK